MRISVRILAVGSLIVAPLGCNASTTPTPDEQQPLTVEEWKNMPTEAKYQGATFERLKLGEPKLQDDRGWDKFQREVLLPARKKEKIAVVRER